VGEAVDFLDLPFDQRKLIIVGAPPEVSQLRLSPPPPAAAVQLFRLARGHPAIVIGAATAGAVVFGAVRAWQYIDVSRKKRGGVVFVDHSVADALEFPGGTCVDGQVYAAHPSLPRVYFPISDYNLYLLQDRVGEYMRLLRELGAEEIEVRADGVESADALRVALSLPVTVSQGPLAANLGQADLTMGVHRKVSSSASLYWRGEACRSPDFNIGDYIWVAGEPALHEVVRACLRQTTYETRIELRSRTDFGIDAKAEARLLKSGYKLGGNVRQLDSQNLKIHAKFPELSG
jgi:hypothetical protein